jgi:uncharacterized OB-fold protein
MAAAAVDPYADFKYSKATELVNAFASEPDPLGAAVDYLAEMHAQMNPQGRKRPRLADPMAYGGVTYAAPMVMAPQYGVPRRGGAPVVGENGNWRCPECTNINFGTRDTCNRCNAPKPEFPDDAPAPPKAKPEAGVDGAWECEACKNVNFASRTACFRCGRPKDGVEGGAVPISQKGQAPVEGDRGNWRCPACGNVNFPNRTSCNRCKAPKPQMMVIPAGQPMMYGMM